MNIQAAFSDRLLQPDVIGPLVAVPGFFATIIATLVTILWFRARSERARHAMLQLLVEKGQAVPPDFFAPRRPPLADLRRGLLLLAIGIGLGIALLLLGAFPVAGFALIPTLMGAGYLVVWRIDARQKERAPEG